MESQTAVPHHLFDFFQASGVRLIDIAAHLGISHTLVSLWRQNQRAITESHRSALLHLAFTTHLSMQEPARQWDKFYRVVAEHFSHLESLTAEFTRATQVIRDQAHAIRRALQGVDQSMESATRMAAAFDQSINSVTRLLESATRMAAALDQNMHSATGILETLGPDQQSASRAILGQNIDRMTRFLETFGESAVVQSLRRDRELADRLNAELARYEQALQEASASTANPPTLPETLAADDTAEKEGDYAKT